MEKLRMTSPDLTEANIDKLAELFPTVITETLDADGNPQRAVDFDLLRQELSDHVVEGPQERYRLDWPGKRAAIFAANAPIAKTLRPVREESVDFDTTKNLFIEGDNLDALKLLQESYLGKVKLIYIDPPYNTGHDFVYNDDFAQTTDQYLLSSSQSSATGERLTSNSESNGRFHSDWLTMMYSRLKLARNLLSEDGFIYISIDDGEVANLRKLADEVFGAPNFVANVIWQKKYTRANDAQWFSDTHDHILCYARSKSNAVINLLPRDESQLAAYSNPDNHSKGPWKATPLHAKSGTDTSPYTFKNGVIWSPPAGTFRRFSDESLRRMDAHDEIWFGRDGSQTPSRKSFLSEVKSGVTPITIWPYDEVGHNHEANSELKKIGLGGMFSNPKPTRLIQRIISLSTGPDDIVLDFFAGSGTTAQATIAQNSADNGRRRFILVQLDEMFDLKSEAAKNGFDTISSLARERIRRVGSEEAGRRDCASIDAGFRSLHIDSSNKTDVLRTSDEVGQLDLDILRESIKPGRLSDDLVFQVMVDWGLDLSLSIKKEQFGKFELLNVEDGVLLACFDRDLGAEVVHEMARRQPMRAVFRDDGFGSDSARINAEQIFRELSPATEVKAI